MKQCSKCNKEKEVINGSWCRECRAQKERERRLAKGMKPKPKPRISEDYSHKECLKCHKTLSLDNFRPNKRGRCGVAAYCAPCEKQYHKERRSNNPGLRNKDKIATQKYRDKHREHWRGLHRINQYNRRSKIEALSDGTVTEKFMKSLYSESKCYWCGQETPEDKRTAEHIIPLDKGGIHGVSNLTMACLSCNCSKLNFK